jgi:uncharacterized membrane protein (UPF0127 family)
MRRMNVRTVLGIFAVLVAACHRVPEEPAPAASTRAQEVVIAPVTSTPDVKTPAHGDANALANAAPARCIVPTPEAAPAPVSRGPAANCPRDPGGAGMLRTVTIGVPEATAGATKIAAEVATHEEDRERGLMYRTSMPEDHGMIFDMQEHSIHRFWMRNTCIPLDMLFVERDGLVVGILENVPTMNDDERAVLCPSSYVLEMNAGWARRHGVRAGQRLTLPPL